MPEPCVLDTSLVSMLFRKDNRAIPYYVDLDRYSQSISVQTVAEKREGALIANWGDARCQALEEFLRSFVVLQLADEVAHEWARIRVEGRRAGARLEAGDAWIAATAATLGGPLLTHDTDFNSVSCPGVTVIRFDDQGNRV